jgi:general secretion pathway protein D
MNRSTPIAVFIASTVLATAALAQQQDRGAPTAPQAASAPGTEVPPVTFVQQALSPAAADAQRRREEASVDLGVLLARVSEATGKKFLVDPRVRMQIYAVPKVETPTYAELLTILHMHGYAAAEVEGRVTIVPDANARFLPTRLVQRDDASVPDDEFVTRILTVPNGVFAGNLVPILRPLMPQSAHLAAYVGDEQQPGNKLILMDTYANVRRMTEIINTLTR